MIKRSIFVFRFLRKFVFLQKIKSMKKNLFIVLISVFALNVNAQQDIIFSANIDKDTLRIGEVFKIEFALEGGSFNNVDIPDFDGFEIVSGPYQSMETQIVNGAIHQRISYGFRLRPTRSGELIIRPATAQVKGETIMIDPVRLYVLNEKVDPNYTPNLQEEFFDLSFPPTPTPPTPPKKKRKTIKI